MTNRIIRFGRAVGHGVLVLWKRYHFLVPPRIIKRYIVYLLAIISGKKSPYYNPLDKKQYRLWIEENKTIKQIHPRLKYQPLISVLLPVYNVDKEYLVECIESILGQSYGNFEICVVDDASTNKETIETLKEYEHDKRVKIRYRKKNGHISLTTNDALNMAKGEYVALMDDDDVLDSDALMNVVLALNEDPEIDMIYTDEDKLDVDGLRCDPNFKSDFAPDSLMSSNYISHLCVLRKKIVKEIGGFRAGYEGAQDYDLYLRFVEKTNKIRHIPKILYHWRMIPGSTAAEIDNKSYALERGRKALQDALERRGIVGDVEIAEGCPYYIIKYKVENNPKVSIIIPTKDAAVMTSRCVESIYEKTTYRNFEVIVVNNNSVKTKTFKMFEEFKLKYDNFRVVDANFPFNYAKINNLAAREASGEYMVLLNNDTKIITPDWLELMLGYASLKHIGAVGVKLLYPDNTIQHSGVILGIGVASHAFVGEKSDAIVWGGRLSVPYNYSAVTAACLMVAKRKWDEVGGMDEELKVAYNDVDFNLKLLEKGYYNVFLPMVKVYHYESKSRGLDSSPKKKARFDREQKYMRNKWSKRIADDQFYNPNYTREIWYMLPRKKQ